MNEKNEFNKNSITRIRPTIEFFLGADTFHNELIESKVLEETLRTAKRLGFVDESGKSLIDRVFMYNPDAVGMWLYKKHKDIFKPLELASDVREEILTVFPPVTPVCFGSMYTGMMPEYHGILKYEKPVLKADTIFDFLPKTGKRAAIICTKGDSIAEIFKGRKIDYYIYPTVDECNSKAEEIIISDNYDLIVLYNGNYDYYMHRFAPEGKRSLNELKKNIDTYCRLKQIISENWAAHKTFLGFAPDHGCHRSVFPPGNHGKNIPKDMNTIHFYSFI